MSATVGDLNPKTIENAKRQFVEALRLRPGPQHVPEDRAGPRLLGRAGPAGAELPYRRSVFTSEAAGHPDRRGWPRRGRRVRRVAIPAAAA